MRDQTTGKSQLIAFVLTAYCVIAGCKKPTAPSAAPGTTAKTSGAFTTLVSAIPLPVEDEHYIGSDACQSCHADQHQSWHASYHRTMTQPINPATAPQAIIDNEVVVAGKKYRFDKKGDDFLVTRFDSFTRAEEEHRLVMMTGSHHMHVFWIDSGIEKRLTCCRSFFCLTNKNGSPVTPRSYERHALPTNQKMGVGIVFAANAIRLIPNQMSKRITPKRSNTVRIQKSLNSALAVKLVMDRAKSMSRYIGLRIRFHPSCPTVLLIQ